MVKIYAIGPTQAYYIRPFYWPRVCRPILCLSEQPHASLSERADGDGLIHTEAPGHDSTVDDQGDRVGFFGIADEHEPGVGWRLRSPRSPPSHNHPAGGPRWCRARGGNRQWSRSRKDSEWNSPSFQRPLSPRLHLRSRSFLPSRRWVVDDGPAIFLVEHESAFGAVLTHGEGKRGKSRWPYRLAAAPILASGNLELCRYH